MSKKRGFFGLFKRKKSKEEVQQEESFATEEFQQDNNSIQEEFQPDDASAEEEKENQQENMFVTEEFQQDNISLEEKLRQENTSMEEDFQQENRFVEEELQQKDTFMEKESQRENGSVQEEVQQENSLMKEQVQQDSSSDLEKLQKNSVVEKESQQKNFLAAEEKQIQKFIQKNIIQEELEEQKQGQQKQEQITFQKVETVQEKTDIASEDLENKALSEHLEEKLQEPKLEEPKLEKSKIEIKQEETKTEEKIQEIYKQEENKEEVQKKKGGFFRFGKENTIIEEKQIVEEQEENIQVNSDENNLLLEETQTEELLDSTKKKKEKKGFFKKLVEGLAKTRNNIAQGFDSIFSGFSSIDDDFYEELEEILIMADLGVATTTKIIEDLQAKVKEQKIKEPSDCKQLLIESIKQQMQVDETAYDFEDKTSVVLLIGVNGVGKTTSVGKLAGQMKQRGKKVMVAAADTFRAAAIEQLTEWAKRANVEIIAQQEGSDPAAVVFDAVTAAKSRNTDILFCDTAGRLHNKKNLMEELRKINRVIDREYPDAYRETLVVLDGTTGQNALAQAKQFNEVAEITGIVLTKLDGTAKGGIAIAIQAELGIPVKYIGIGEKIEDLQRFDADAFVNALFDVERLEEE